MAEPDAHYYRPPEGTGLPHDPFKAIVGPRPIGWISSLSSSGEPNLAPYSFFNAFNYRPPLRPIPRAGGPAAYAEIRDDAMFSMTRPDDRP